MDNPTSEPSTKELDAVSAGSLIGALIEPETPEATDGAPPVDTEIEIDAEAKPESSDPEMVEVDIDGYKVSLPKDKAEKLAAERLMQADYTKKTMATAEERKAATAQQQQAMQARNVYAHNLQRMQAQLEGAMQEQ